MTTSEHIRTARIIRAWYAVLSAYPEALTPFCVSETAKRARVSRSDVLASLGRATRA